MPLPKPICFMIMPYSTKATQKREGSPAPDKVDCNRLWTAALKPAIEDLGYEAVRADQDLGASIITEMIERLAISDLVIADISIPNGNVYYEVGVRHASKQRGCVLISADWAQPLFDIAQFRGIRYPLSTESVSDDEAIQIRKKLTAGIPGLAQGDSPVFSCLPGFPNNVDATRASSFRTAIEELSKFQARVEAARSAPPDQARALTVALRDEFMDGRPVPSAVLMELLYLVRDCTDWQTTVLFIAALPADLQAVPLVKEQLALAQSKSGDHIAAIGALRQLIAMSGDSSERRGLLGGRYKKLYNLNRDPLDLDRAIAEYEQGMTLDLNDYYPSSNLARLYRTRKKRGDEDKARTSAAVTATACERARKLGSKDPWLKPTLLGAAFDSGNVDKAGTLADEIKVSDLAEWKLTATLDDLRVSISFYTGDTATQLAEIADDLQSLIKTLTP
jgi:tetratricopeptide (TPR) repeat protein